MSSAARDDRGPDGSLDGHEREGPQAPASRERDVTVVAAAKINLTLRVLEKESSGYHRIESLFAAIGLSDTIRIVLGAGEPAATPEAGSRARTTTATRTASPTESRVELVVHGDEPLGPPDRNLAVRATRAYLDRIGRGSARDVVVHLEKRIPVGAGLGGGSSDAAAVLKALNELHGGALDRPALMSLGATLGADVPFFLGASTFSMVGGLGDVLRGVPPLPSRPVVLVVPDYRMATGAAYEALDGRRSRDAGPGPLERPSIEGGDLADWEGVAEKAENDFEDVVFGKWPDARSIRDLLLERGGRPALLTGSGSALFGVFEREADAAAAAESARERFPTAEVHRSRTLVEWP